MGPAPLLRLNENFFELREMLGYTETNSHEELSNLIDRLESNGRNWFTFWECLTTVVKRNGVFDHFDGSRPKPILGNRIPTDEELAAHMKLVAAWTKREQLAMYLITVNLPDSIFVKYMRKGTVTEIWSGLVLEFTLKCGLVLCGKFMHMRYETHGADLRAQLEDV